MPQTLEKRVRSSYGVEGDGYFRTEAIIDRINGSYLKTVSILAQIEERSGKPLRALDKLRHRKKMVVDGEVKTENKYEVTSLPTPDDVHEFLYLSFFDYSIKKTVPMDELSTRRLMMLEIGNAIPTKAEMYYHRITEADTTPTPLINVYGYEMTQGEDEVRLYYIKEPALVGETDIYLPDLPKYLEEAVIMDTCSRMALKDPDQKHNPEMFDKKFQVEIKNNSI